MCEPIFYGVEYVINPHMEGNIGKVNKHLAYKQWSELYGILSNLANVELIEQTSDVPDMVFTANAGLTFLGSNYVWLSHFTKSERQSEESLFAQWFKKSGFDVINQKSANVGFFEGAGDGLVDSEGRYWLGYGFRSSRESLVSIASFFNTHEFNFLQLKDPRFYHLDTCFCPLSRGHTIWYPEAFTTASYWSVAMRNGRGSGVLPEPQDVVESYEEEPDLLIDVELDDALRFACNAVCVDDTVIVPECSDQLQKSL